MISRVEVRPSKVARVDTAKKEKEAKARIMERVKRVLDGIANKQKMTYAEGMLDLAMALVNNYDNNNNGNNNNNFDHQ